ncbi:MAG: galactose-1-phosphate uridylyltransferase [Deltaproteobacteria bacterium]|nr:galactose-1-phosphate uridylyltransferase [Deltaproteobacteria bacterium]
MSELRLNLLTREWVVIAAERARRPAEFKLSRPQRPVRPAFEATCPFCVGNEGKTGDEHFRINDGNGWLIRVVGNKYPALSSSGERTRSIDPIMRSVSGVGRHEVIIESPAHDKATAFYTLGHLEGLLETYRERFNEAYKDERVEHVIIFKNHGEGAGTAIAHPHSQLIATPVVPYQFRDRVRSAMHYFDDTGECLQCAMLKRERREGVRVIMDTAGFMTFIPYAALSPFHTWIFPKRHGASFAGITAEEVKDLAMHIKSLFTRFHHGLDDPDFNYSIRSSRPLDEGNEYCHWYISVVPRLSKAAGFELGSGMFINSVIPEESAAFLRAVRAE